MTFPANASASSNVQAVALEMPLSAAAGENEMRERLLVIRDTLIVLGIQLSFRAGILLRRWNM
jgi:hypothetical protein